MTIIEKEVTPDITTILDLKDVEIYFANYRFACEKFSRARSYTQETLNNRDLILIECWLDICDYFYKSLGHYLNAIGIKRPEGGYKPSLDNYLKEKCFSVELDKTPLSLDNHSKNPIKTLVTCNSVSQISTLHLGSYVTKLTFYEKEESLLEVKASITGVKEDGGGYETITNLLLSMYPNNFNNPEILALKWCKDDNSLLVAPLSKVSYILAEAQRLSKLSRALQQFN